MSLLVSFTSFRAFLLVLSLGVSIAQDSRHDEHQHNRSGDDITKILDDLVKGYDKRVRPNYGKSPVEIGVTMYVLSVSSISEANMDYTVDAYFRQVWNDPRLKFTGANGVKTISVGSEYAKSLWLPDTFFVNEKRSYFHTTTTNNEFFRISDDGQILRSIRLSITASCPMDLRHFPMDSQLCPLEIESYGHTMSDIKYTWAKGKESIGISPQISLPQFKIQTYRQDSFEISLSSGNYSRLSCKFHFVRSVGYYLLQIYTPAVIIVLISWMSYWINRGALTVRIALGVTTVLTMAMLMQSTNATLPKISYVKAVDVYLIICFLMVVASLLNTFTVLYLNKHLQAKLNNTQRQKMKELLDEEDKFQGEKETTPSKTEPNSPEDVTTFANKMMTFCRTTPYVIDKYSRLLFLVFFLLFNIIYWATYLSVSGIDNED